MAIKTTSLPPDTIETLETAIAILINNGDYKLLDAIQKKWGFKNKEDILRFALVVLYKSEDKKVYIDSNGEKIGISPADDLLTSSSNTSETTPDAQSAETPLK